ncbi:MULTISPECIES: polysaccharide deacetylase family protein [Bacillus cereus group]|uniref:Peptidoglycan-N-acetylglucosamine deacetylase n=1 Tax=Bacillus thuringiensis TaxID=1428 RepID=A0A9X6WR93_BACTU|nr:MULTISPECIES: polysaccharide deacetylase family protein [Bacillus cereus group]PFJ42718.1 peptidoglycan-N-acetylglucosamine deacetylase [Bacillus thuringiensis]PGP21031.1 peptidoglycan-N-acetylglucosamine deacetylase [Bacillus cereus]
MKMPKFNMSKGNISKKGLCAICAVTLGVGILSGCSFDSKDSNQTEKKESMSKEELAKQQELKKKQKELEEAEKAKKEYLKLYKQTDGKDSSKKPAVPVKSDEKVAYLTFDDGPNENTKKVLETLAKYKINATFFVLGNNAAEHPETVKAALEAGHYVGMHSMSHNFNKLYKQKQFVPEMKKEQEILSSNVGITPHLVRPPYGSKPGLKQDIRDQLAASQLHVWDWTIDSLDWTYNKKPKSESVPAIVNNILKHATGKQEIILMHDIHSQSAAALPAVIEGLKAKGYTFKPYDENSHIEMNFWHDNRL